MASTGDSKISILEPCTVSEVREVVAKQAGKRDSHLATLPSSPHPLASQAVAAQASQTGSIGSEPVLAACAAATSLASEAVEGSRRLDFDTSLETP